MLQPTCRVGLQDTPAGAGAMMSVTYPFASLVNVVVGDPAVEASTTLDSG